LAQEWEPAGRFLEGGALRGEDAARHALPVPSDAEWPLPTSRGLSTGPKTREGIERIRRAVTKHGKYSEASKAERRHIRLLIKECRAALARIEEVR